MSNISNQENNFVDSDESDDEKEVDPAIKKLAQQELMEKIYLKQEKTQLNMNPKDQEKYNEDRSESFPPQFPY